MEIKINVYNDDMKTVKKKVAAELVDIPFGVIRRFMSLFQIEDFDNKSEVLNVVSKSWGEVTRLLTMIFPTMTDDDFDTVKMRELIEVVMEVLKYSFGEMLNVPVDEKN